MNATTKNNAVVLAERPAALLPINNVADLEKLGTVLAQSKLFGANNPAEGLAIVAMCQQKRISWMDFMQNFHMIQGRIAKKTDAILADFHRMGGKHEIISRTPEVAEAKFTLGKATYESKVSWEDCKLEPFVYNGKESDILAIMDRGDTSRLVVKAKYRTPRSRMQMLWARCVSDGVRVVSPECVQGIYTPEETEDFTEAPVASPIAPNAMRTEPAVFVAESTSPLSVEVCPCGPASGKRWDDQSVFTLDTLKQAIQGTNPLLTPEVKDYVRGIIQAREEVLASAQKMETPEMPIAEEVHNV